MLAGSRLVAFLATRRPLEARAFYSDVVGLRLITDDPFALVFDAGGTMLRIQKVPEVAPPPYTAAGWDVPDIRAAARDLAERGLSFERYADLAQDSSGIWTSPGGALVAWFKDPDGHTLSLTQFPG